MIKLCNWVEDTVEAASNPAIFNFVLTLLHTKKSRNHLYFVQKVMNHYFFIRKYVNHYFLNKLAMNNYFFVGLGIRSFAHRSFAHRSFALFAQIK